MKGKKYLTAENCIIGVIALAVTVAVICFGLRWMKQSSITDEDIMVRARLIGDQYPAVEAEIRMLSPQPDLVILGDSIMAKERTDNTVPSYLIETTGLSVYNAAFGGSCAQTTNREGRESYHEDSLNLYQLQEAICSGDFGVQLADLPNNPYQTSYFSRTVLGLSNLDFTTVRYLIIEHGTNDCISGLPLSNPEDPYATDTYEGALRTSIEALQKTYPQLQIILVSPTYCRISGTDRKFTEVDFGYGTVEDFYEKQLEIAGDYGLPVVDVLHEAGLNEDNILSLTEDGVHLNHDGRELYGTYLAQQMQLIISDQ